MKSRADHNSTNDRIQLTHVLLTFKEAIMKIQVAVTFPSFPRITPVLQAVLFEDPADARFLTIWPVSQVIY